MTGTAAGQQPAGLMMLVLWPERPWLPAARTMLAPVAGPSRPNRPETSKVTFRLGTYVPGYQGVCLG